MFFALLLGTLIAGTLQVGLLTDSYATFTLGEAWATGLQSWLDRVVPPNPALGIEGVSVHGVLLIGLLILILIGVPAWKGLNTVRIRSLARRKRRYTSRSSLFSAPWPD